MFILDSKHGEVKVFANTVENEAMSQILQMANSPLGESSHIRIMPDCHAGKGCTVGTTMIVNDKVCPNIVGVDIGCGVTLGNFDEDISNRLDELDSTIRSYVPYGFGIHEKIKPYYFENLRCWSLLNKETRDRAMRSLGTLGGGNHFLEGYHNSISVHTGSRNIGAMVANHYSKLAKSHMKNLGVKIQPELSYLTDDLMEDYLHDMGVMQVFAHDNRSAILYIIESKMNLHFNDTISTIHNYIDLENKILRKGSVSAKDGEVFVLPLNMRDGIFICKGKGNPDWNHSSPHGAGRLYSRSKAKAVIKIEEYRRSMDGIYSTCVSESTIDESPFAYKDAEEIVDCIKDTADILKHIKPIYNFKAN